MKGLNSLVKTCGRAASSVRAAACGLVAATGLFWASGASGAEANAPASPRDRVQAERAHAEAQYVERERACRTQFAISGCLEAASARRRETLTRLRRQDIEIDDAERRERAAARRARIEAKTAGAASAVGVAAPVDKAVPEPLQRNASDTARVDASTADGMAPSDTAVTPRRRPRPASPSHAPRLARPATDRTAQEAIERAAFERKQQQAAAHREAVERRNADPAKRGQQAAPLPVPAGSSR